MTPKNEKETIMGSPSPRAEKEKPFRNPNLDKNLTLATPALRGEELIKTMSSTQYNSIFGPNKV